jgi:hypothetical protein
MGPKNKKGVEMSMNLIIIAVIALLILVVVILIFTGAASKFVGGTSDCGKKGGTVNSANCAKCSDTDTIRYPLGDDSKTKECCCVPSGVPGLT